MKNVVANLLELQKLDLGIIEFEINIKRLNQQSALIQNKIEELGKKKIEITNLISSLQTALNQAKAALEINNDRLARSETRLNNITNVSELNAVKKEIDTLKKQKIVLNDRLDKVSAEETNYKNQIAEIEKTVQELQANLEKEKQESLHLNNKLKENINELSSKKGDLTKDLDRETLSKYLRISKARNGLAVVKVDLRGQCGGCNFRIAPNLLQIVKLAKTLTCCPHCHRFLYDESATTNQVNA